MNKNLLNPEIQEFISKNTDTDVVSLLLKKPFFVGASNKELAQQIVSRKKTKTKLPTWYNTPNIYFPDKLHIEQASSEITAKYKATLVSGNSLVDVTGGFGVDTYFFSLKIDNVQHCETNRNLSEIVAHNFKVFGRKNISIIPGDGLVFLEKSQFGFDWVYLDPSRRNDQKGKVFFLKDCFPNVIEHLDLLFKKSNNVMLKTSPILDMSVGMNELRFVKEIHIVALKNEVKELLWILQAGFDGETTIKTVNFDQQKTDTFNFALQEEKKAVPNFSAPQNYLYEPNSAILKSGAFSLIAERYALGKIHKHSQLYTSKELKDFPGRAFRIEKVWPFSKKTMKALKLKKANITVRNFPHSVDAIRKRFNILSGGADYLFFTTHHNSEKIIIHCKK
ncbi:class I SAM-dependent methyltransferase [Ulvibacterium sp.]|uniref:THUMP-like domain-containing protein n=1 Tax=Ulvibacterium sp. TaxID=2665914 RepID=UPI00261E2487|nr:class I SAM-dependent methyltransferase [Ulvibacterium sp.]